MWTMTDVFSLGHFTAGVFHVSDCAPGGFDLARFGGLVHNGETEGP